VQTALQQTETAVDTYVNEIKHNRTLKEARDSAAKATGQARALFRFARMTTLDVLMQPQQYFCDACHFIAHSRGSAARICDAVGAASPADRTNVML
jgi:isopropylmalate/homocitrate/citramalate synthase